MAYINVSGPNSNAIIQVSTSTAIASTTTGYVIPALQDITINNAAGVFSWQQLDEFAVKNVPTPANNSLTGNFVLDSTTFFSGSNGVPGLFDLQNDAELVYFRVYFEGKTVSGKKYVAGKGYITNLAPTVNPTAPVWVSPITLAVDGDLTVGTV